MAKIKSIEEKAKAYDEAIKYGQYLINERCKEGTDGSFHCSDLQKMFPELNKESEDEKTRKEILYYIIKGSESLYDVQQYGKEKFEKWIAWLEKKCEQKFEQKFFINDKVIHKETGKTWTIHWYLADTNSYYVEDNDGLLHHYRESELKLVEQKPTEWSEEDEKMLKKSIKLFDEFGGNRESGAYTLQEMDCRNCADWLKSLKDRVFPIPQQEWSEEDEDILNTIINHFKIDIECTDEDDVIRWLKSLKGRYTWKPSKEQMEALWNVYKGGKEQAELATLYNDLKKLKG